MTQLPTTGSGFTGMRQSDKLPFLQFAQQHLHWTKMFLNSFRKIRHFRPILSNRFSSTSAQTSKISVIDDDEFKMDFLCDENAGLTLSLKN